MAQTCVWIVLLPILAFIIQVFFGKRLPRQGDWVSVGAIVGSFILSLPIVMAFFKTGNVSDTLSFTWISLPLSSAAGGTFFRLVIGTLVNNLTAMMLLMVTLVCSLIHIYSMGYMKGEARYHLFFAYLSLFSAGMLGLVVSDNLFTFFMCWEIMGLCSYLLIGFYYEKPSASQASLKAFMTTRVGDVCFFLGIMALWYLFGTLNFHQLYEMVAKPEVQAQTIAGLPALTFVGLMLLMGTIGKSAQFPLHVWLPDAMEGPTPVSALIHAATMVAAGVFLLVRMYPVLEASHGVLVLVAYVGGFTALFAACIALVQMDIKKVLAYSTISQLGYMVMGIGVGAFAAGFLHLITHAVFKACLFLCSGSVIHAVHTNDMSKMGGLKSKMPWTFATMSISTLAISGLPFFSGFVSKDRILAKTLAYGMEHSSHLVIPIFGFTAAALTAFYMFRLIYMTFCGGARDESRHHHAHESPAVMVAPLVVLASLTFAFWYAGPTGIEIFDRPVAVHWFERGIETTQTEMGITLSHGNEEIAHTAHSLALIFSLALAGLGILMASLVYLRNVISAAALRSWFRPLYTLFWNKFYFDELYINVFIKKCLLPWNWLLARFDDLMVDRVFVDGWKDVTLILKSIVGGFDNIVIDRLMVDGTGYATTTGGWLLRRFQTGKIQTYLLWMLIVLGAFLALML